jgi:cell division protein FtsB
VPEEASRKHQANKMERLHRRSRMLEQRLEKLRSKLGKRMT